MVKNGEVLWEIIGKGLEYSTIVDEKVVGFQGLRYAKDPTNGVIIALSSRNSEEKSRWMTKMPSMEGFGQLKELDLHKNRYIRQLDDSICNLVFLQTLILTRCERIQRLPEQIGNLQHLSEVCYVKK